MTYEISVVAPCYNEEGNIPELVERMLGAFRKKGLRGQFVLVNDGSADATAALIDRYAAAEADVVARHHPTNRGIAAGWNTGVEAAEGKYVCLIDADLQYLPEDVPRLYREILYSNADVVQGYRSSIGRLRDSRFLLSKGLNVLLNGTFAMDLRDNKSGFVIALRDTMQDILRHRFSYRHFQTFIAASAKAKGYTVREVETLFESRLAGQSYMARLPWRVIGDVLTDLAKAAVEFRLQPKRENILQDFLRTQPPRHHDAPLPLTRRAHFDLYCATMPLHKWVITSRARLYYDELKASQWLGHDQIKQLQQRKLRRLVHHAYHHVSDYRERMDARGLRPDDIHTLQDLQRLPLLSKADIRESIYFGLMSDNHDKQRVLKVTTSGSTGEPFVLYVDQHQLEIRWASTLRAMEWTGWTWGDRHARLWHQTLGLDPTQVAREKLDALISRRRFVPAYEMSSDSMDRIIDQLRRYAPVLLDGYAESFNLIAEYLKHSNKGSGLNVRSIMSSAQILPDNVRRTIESELGCEVFDKYGSREFSGIAYECEAHDGHHVCAESYIVELIKDGRPARPGETGEVVITDLNNYVMPLIRYRIGDIAVAMDDSVACRCGRGLPRIGKIEGRVQSIIITQDGTYLPGTFFAHLFKDYDYLVKQYQVTQQRVGQITLKIIKARRFTDAEFGRVLGLLRRYVGEGTQVDVQFVDDIPLGATGKHRESVSSLDLDFQRLARQTNEVP